MVTKSFVETDITIGADPTVKITQNGNKNRTRPI